MDALSLFNQQVLECQDDAYTLAWYLLGDETEAEACVQAAVLSVYRNNLTGKQRCRLSILRAVIQHSQARLEKAVPVTGRSRRPWIMNLLWRVADGERLVLVLVDILELRHPEAAALVGISLQDFQLRLAQARRKLAGSPEAADEAALPVGAGGEYALAFEPARINDP